MSDTSENAEITEEAPAVETPPAAEPPQYVSIADFERITRENAARADAQMAEVRSLVASLARAPRATEPAPSGGDLTDEQLQAAVDEGRMTHAQMVSAITRRENKRFAAEHIEPLRATGLKNISALSKSVAMASLREDGKPMFPHARRFAKEIDALLEQHTAGGGVVNPEVYAEAYRYVLGGHTDEIAAEAAQAAVRGANPGAPERPTGGRAGRSATAAPTLSIESVLGPTAANAMEAKMRQRGWNQDQWAQALGYKGIDDYLKVAQSQGDA